jgi:hypothetical protein
VLEHNGDLEDIHQFINDAVAQLLTRNSGVIGRNCARVASLLSDTNNPPESWPPRSLPTHDVRWVNLLVPTKASDDFSGSLVDVASDTEALYGEAQVFLAEGDSFTDDQKESLTQSLSEFTEHVSVSTADLGAHDHDHSLEHPQETTVVEFLPGLTKVDLAVFQDGQAAYDELTAADERNIVLDHSFLMELGVMLNEPSVRFEGVAGECIWGCACWVGVPMDRVNGTNLEVEIEPLAYVLGGAGGHVGYQGARWSYTLEVFGLTVPESLHGNEGFDAAPLGAELHVERSFGSKRGGWYAGPEIGVNRLAVTHEPTGAEQTRIRYGVGLRGGYQWFPGWGDLYLSPVAGLVYTLNSKPIQIQNETFETGPLTPFVTVGLGWSF